MPTALLLSLSAFSLSIPTYSVPILEPAELFLPPTTDDRRCDTPRASVIVQSDVVGATWSVIFYLKLVLLYTHTYVVSTRGIKKSFCLPIHNVCMHWFNPWHSTSCSNIALTSSTPNHDSNPSHHLHTSSSQPISQRHFSPKPQQAQL